MNELIARHVENKNNCGALPCPDGYAHFKGSCGDSLEMFLYIADGKINTVTFLVHGCDYIHACASVLTELVMGRKLFETDRLEGMHIEKALGGLPREHRHCANLVVRTFREVIADYQAKRRATRQSIS
jgi:NifU-like protein involved in Fe-S cluster formation